MLGAARLCRIQEIKSLKRDINMPTESQLNNFIDVLGDNYN